MLGVFSSEHVEIHICDFQFLSPHREKLVIFRAVNVKPNEKETDDALELIGHKVKLLVLSYKNDAFHGLNIKFLVEVNLLITVDINIYAVALRGNHKYILL